VVARATAFASAKLENAANATACVPTAGFFGPELS
jgi:hypothetical protein